jgi:inner membrane protein involved in colicin E2 resistance
MESIGKICLMVGFLILISAQIYLTLIAFKRKFIDGFLCIVLPAYVCYFALKKETQQNKVLIIWGSGVVLLILSAFMLTT